MDAIQFGQWFSARRRAGGWRSQRALAEAAQMDPDLCQLGVTEPFLARLEAGVLAHPFGGVSRQRVLALAGLLCATRRQLSAYLRAAELGALDPAEDALYARLEAGVTSPRIPPLFLLPPRPPMLIGRETMLHRLLHAITAQPSGVYVISGMPGVGKSAIAVETFYRLAAEPDARRLFPAGMIRYDCAGRLGSAGVLSLLNDIARTFAPSAAQAGRPHDGRAAGASAARTSAERRRVDQVALDGLAHLGLDATGVESGLCAATDYVRTLLMGKRVAILLDNVEPTFPWRRALAALQTWRPAVATRSSSGVAGSGAGSAGAPDDASDQLILATTLSIPPVGVSAHHIAVAPLPTEAGVTLLSHAMGRLFVGEEAVHAARLCEALGGAPLAIEAAATAAITCGLPLAWLAAQAIRDPLALVFVADDEARSLLSHAFATLDPSALAWYATLSTVGTAFGLAAAAAHPIGERCADSNLLTNTGADGDADGDADAEAPAQTTAAALLLGQFVQRSLLERVCAPTTPPPVSDGSVSLGAPTPALRYRVHPLLYAYAAEHFSRLDSASADAIRQRAVSYALTFLTTHAQDAGAIEQEAATLLAAVEQAWLARQYAITLQLVSGVEPHLMRVASATVGKRIVGYAASAAVALDERREIVRWLEALGLMRYYLGEGGAARRAWEDAAELAEQTGALTHALGNLASLASEHGDYPQAMDFNARQRASYQAAGSSFGVAFTRVEAASFARRHGEARRASAELAAVSEPLTTALTAATPGAALLALETALECARLERADQRAGEYAERSRALALTTCTHYTVARFCLEQAEYALDRRHAERAAYYAREAITVAAPLDAARIWRRGFSVLERLATV